MNHEELEQEVQRQGSSLKLLDELIKKNRIGVPTVMAYRCSHSGLYYPANYIKQWGKTTGIGLGPEPVSECLDTNYEGQIMPLEKVRSLSQLSLPVNTTKAQVDLCNVPEDEYKAGALVLAFDDPEYELRMEAVMPRQLEKSPQLRVMHQEFLRSKKGGR